jgi:hypothetical protein
VTIKGLLLAAAIIAIAFLFSPYFKTGAPHDTGTHREARPRAPYPCESDRSAQCTWEQYKQIAEEDCAKHRDQGGRCEVVTDGRRPPHAVRLPSDSELADMRQKIGDGIQQLCDNLADTRFECKTNH